jgi:glycosyltransferase involved in cell wall biosynthesis
LSRPFKKIEDFLKIADFFYKLNYLSFNFYITLTGKEDNYSRWLFKKFGQLPNVVWLGKIDREQVFNLYEKAECLIFTSHLETWGLPLTEFSLTNKTIIAPDLPYVHETLAGYPKLALYNANNVIELLELSLRVAKGKFIEYSDTIAEDSDHHSVDGWNNLLSLIIESA